MFLPQCDGPFVIERMCDNHTCVLHDAISDEPFQDGKHISLARLVEFKYPKSCIGEGASTEDRVLGLDFAALRPNMLVASYVKNGQTSRVHVAKVIQTFIKF